MKMKPSDLHFVRPIWQCSGTGMSPETWTWDMTMPGMSGNAKSVTLCSDLGMLRPCLLGQIGSLGLSRERPEAVLGSVRSQAAEEPGMDTDPKATGTWWADLWRTARWLGSSNIVRVPCSSTVHKLFCLSFLVSPCIHPVDWEEDPCAYSPTVFTLSPVQNKTKVPEPWTMFEKQNDLLFSGFISVHRDNLHGSIQVTSVLLHLPTQLATVLASHIHRYGSSLTLHFKGHLCAFFLKLCHQHHSTVRETQRYLGCKLRKRPAGVTEGNCPYKRDTHPTYPTGTT